MHGINTKWWEIAIFGGFFHSFLFAIELLNIYMILLSKFGFFYMAINNKMSELFYRRVKFAGHKYYSGVTMVKKELSKWMNEWSESSAVLMMRCIAAAYWQRQRTTEERFIRAHFRDCNPVTKLERINRNCAINSMFTACATMLLFFRFF